MGRHELVAFGTAVRELRQRRELSQEKLAELCDLHRTYISGVERGQRNLGLVNIYRIARALSVSASELLAVADEHGASRRRPARSG